MNSESRDAVKWLEMQFELTWNEYGDLANIPDPGNYRRSMFTTYDDHPSECQICFRALMDGEGIICLDTTGHTDIITRHDSAVQVRKNE